MHQCERLSGPEPRRARQQFRPLESSGRDRRSSLEAAASPPKGKTSCVGRLRREPLSLLAPVPRAPLAIQASGALVTGCAPPSMAALVLRFSLRSRQWFSLAPERGCRGRARPRRGRAHRLWQRGGRGSAAPFVPPPSPAFRFAVWLRRTPAILLGSAQRSLPPGRPAASPTHPPFSAAGRKKIFEVHGCVAPGRSASPLLCALVGPGLRSALSAPSYRRSRFARDKPRAVRSSLRSLSLRPVPPVASLRSAAAHSLRSWAVGGSANERTNHRSFADPPRMSCRRSRRPNRNGRRRPKDEIPRDTWEFRLQLRPIGSPPIGKEAMKKR